MALLDKWIALDMGAYLARFYDFSTQKQIVLKTIIAKKGKETLGVSDQALAYLYKDLDTIQIQYPISHGQILHSIEPLVQKGLNELHAFDGLLRPSVLVSVPTELSQRQRELWQQMFLDCGVRKVEFISNLNALQEEGSCFLVDILIRKFMCVLMVRCLCQRQFIMREHRLMSRYKGLFTTRRVVLSQKWMRLI